MRLDTLTRSIVPETAGKYKCEFRRAEVLGGPVYLKSCETVTSSFERKMPQPISV